MAVAIVIKLLE